MGAYFLFLTLNLRKIKMRLIKRC